jgi:eukaryotic-like serine/threonine-protein kinase
MSDDRWTRVERIFDHARDLPRDARGAFLATACGGDDAVRAEVLALLDADAAGAGFMAEPALDRLAARMANEAWSFRRDESIGPYTIRDLLGAGGAGEVWRARDERLGREVALKLLPPGVAVDPQRLARFERESRILASLNHPNIASIYDIERIDGLHLLVLELVDGPTLADRLEAGRMAVTEVVSIARQLADALQAAHDRGIVHRDLKPANVKLSPAGTVKLLDFGLAVERLPFDGTSPADMAKTTEGLILGTCAYMSPEQARGQPVDKRTDIWAFGCILFELLAGRRAFDAKTPSDAIAAVLERSPDWTLLPPELPASLRRLVRRCLEKDADRRLHDIADARLDLDDALLPGDGGAVLARAPRRTAAAVVAIVMLATATGALGWWARDALATRPIDRTPARFTWTLPQNLRLDSAPVVSPDGRYIAFTGVVDGAPPRLYVRPLGGLEARPIPRTEGARQPFWSPDGRTLGYFAHGHLLKVAVDGGAPIEICPAPDSRGGTWGREGIIVFAPAPIEAGLFRVSAGGGTPEPITRLHAEHGENSHRWPQFLPDGIHFLYFVRAAAAERRGVYVGRIDRPAAPPAQPLFRSASEAIYAPLDESGRGVLLSAAAGHIDALPFDAARRILTGDPVTLPLPAGGNTPHHASMLSASAGVLTHVASPLPYGQRLVHADRTGRNVHIDSHRGIVNWPRLSPDGTRLVAQWLESLTGALDLWVTDLERGTRIRINDAGTSALLPVWSPDGTRLAYVSGLERPVLTIAAADGTGVISTVPCPKRMCEPSDWSPDGEWLLVTTREPGGVDVWMLPTRDGGTPRPLLTGTFVERDARFSPDGALVAYVSEESGRPEISVRTVDGTPRREVVSVGGGTQPVWSRRGAELFFVDLDGALRSAVIERTTDGRPVVRRVTLVNVPPIGTGHWGTQYDLSPDARRVYFVDRTPGDAPPEIGVVLDWRELLR